MDEEKIALLRKLQEDDESSEKPEEVVKVAVSTSKVSNCLFDWAQCILVYNSEACCRAASERRLCN